MSYIMVVDPQIRGWSRFGAHAATTHEPKVSSFVRGAMQDLPQGIVTFLFTDIEGSTRLARQFGTRFGDVLAEHNRILRDAFTAHDGHEVSTIGDGFFVAFARATDAVCAAVDVQRALAAHGWPDGAAVRVRIGIHTGQAAAFENTYRGLAVHRAARIAAAGHGGQVLVSGSTRALLEDEEQDLPPVELRDLGEHPLKDFDRGVHLYQLVGHGLEETFPPLRTDGRAAEAVVADAEKEAAARIQLCGRLVAEIEGRRIEGALATARPRALFAYLVLNRSRPIERHELIDAAWGSDSPESGRALTAALSKVRQAVGADRLEGRSEVVLSLPSNTFVDVEAALESVHRAESCLAAGQWADAWGPAGIAYHVASRPFLPGLDMPWIDTWRRRLEDARLRGLEAFATAALGLGGPALGQARQYADLLTELAPYRESGYKLLMEALARSGNPAEALRVYDRLRDRLLSDLGLEPGPAVEAVRRRLRGGEQAGSPPA
jgi:SARP family transcriptional regulator, regulator of embCAB operon